MTFNQELLLACFHPVQGYRSRVRNASGVRPIVFNIRDGFADMPVSIPCGYCVGCQLEYARQWAIRCIHEAALYEDNAFLTLTYAPEHLPEHGTLVKADFQKFMKRLRKEIAPCKVRYFHCGEYGAENGRPHYHALLFGYGFPDKCVLESRNGYLVYRSATLEKCWQLGLSEIGNVTFESAAYVARYVMKKAVRDREPVDFYTRVVPDSGELVHLQPEYTTMSRRPGIGKEWIEKWRDDVFPRDGVYVNGMMQLPPRYYVNQLSPLERRMLSAKREEKVDEAKREWRYLETKEEITEARVGLLQRRIE